MAVNFGGGTGISAESTSAASGFFQSNSAANVAPTLITQQFSTSSADLFQAQDSAGSSLFKITSGGYVDTVGEVSINANGFHREVLNIMSGGGHVDSGIGLLDASFDWYIRNSSASSNNLNFFSETNSVTPALTLTQSGNVGIQTSNPIYALEVKGTIAPNAPNSYDLGASTRGFRSIYAQNSLVNTSDARLKRQIQSTDLGLDFVNSLRPVSYYWKQGDQQLHYGLIAQETEAALAKAKARVNSGGSDDMDNVIVSHDHNTDTYGIRYTELISPIIKAIQEMYLQITGLESRMSALHSENAAMKAYLCEKDPAAPFCQAH